MTSKAAVLALLALQGLGTVALLGWLLYRQLPPTSWEADPRDRGATTPTAFVVTTTTTEPDAESIAAAAAERGVPLTVEADDAPQAFRLDDGRTFFVLHVPAPNPDVPSLNYGPLSPPRDAALAAPGHLILTIFGQEATFGQEGRDDATLVQLTAAVMDAVDSVGAILGARGPFVSSELFRDLATDAAPSTVPVQLRLEVTSAREEGDRVSFLTHGLARFGREELYVVSRPGDPEDGLAFTYAMSDWLLLEPEKEFPTGDTVGRTGEERVLVERVPSPDGSGAQVMRLQM